MMPFFTKMNHTQATLDLIKDKNAFGLLALIAVRARRRDGFEFHNGAHVDLKIGQAYIGDYKSCGLSQKEYRNAKKRLVESKYITAQGTNKGTIATIINTDVFDTTMKKEADKGRTKGEQRTTNKDRKKSNIEENDNTYLSQGKENRDEEKN